MNGEPAGPTLGEAQAALRSVLDAPGFQASSRSRDFLGYVVEETLAGRSAALCERTIARRAMGRGPDFDSRLDSSVRVQATRVRDLLRLHYSETGATEPWRIVIPPGRYAVQFERTRPQSALRDLPRIAVAVPKATPVPGASDLADRLGAETASRLSRFHTVAVVGPMASTAATQELQKTAPETYMLTGSITPAGTNRLHASFWLTEPSDSQVIWAFSDECAADPNVRDRRPGHWPRRIAAEVADYAGVVLRWERLVVDEGAAPGRRALLAFAGFIQEGTADSLDHAREAVASAFDAGLRSPLLLAMRGSIFNIEAQRHGGQQATERTSRAEEAARQALELDATLGHAYLVLATSAYLRCDWEVAVRHASTGAAFCEDHPTVLATAATVMATAGDWHGAAQLARRALDLNPALPGYVHTVLAVHYLLIGNDSAALAEADLIHADGEVWGPLYRALALEGLGQRDRALAEARLAADAEPDLLGDPGEYLTRYWSRSGQDCAALLGRLRRLVSALRLCPTEAAL